MPSLIDFLTLSYDYHLPEGAIAQVPAEAREGARLLHLNSSGETRDSTVLDFPKLLQKHDLLVFNDTRVRRSRLVGTRVETGGKAEFFVLDRSHATLRGLLRTRGTPRLGERFQFGRGQLELRVQEDLGQGHYLLGPTEPSTLLDQAVDRLARLPLPPYIERGRESDPRDSLDEERYQTVFAATPGAVAAPTAGLHFGAELLANLRDRGIPMTMVTLHVGLGTFQPLKVEDVREHHIHEERYEFSAEAAEAVSACRERGGRVIAVGTTSARVLETVARRPSPFEAHSGSTGIYILPGHEFRWVDALFTNFHAPKSTLLLLVAALIGRERLLSAYAHALERGYRFLSYGDAMFLEPPCRQSHDPS